MSAVLDTEVTVLRGLRRSGSPWLLRAGDREVGQVITLDLDQLSTEMMLPAPANGAQGNRTQMLIRYARREGVILHGDFAPFHDATVRPASGAEVRPCRPFATCRAGVAAGRLWPWLSTGKSFSVS